MTRWRANLFGAAWALAAVTLLPRLVEAQPGIPAVPFRFSWKAPAGCPEEGELVSQIKSAVGPGVSAEPVHVHAVATQDGERWHADVDLSVGGTTSTRSLTGETCRAVADAVVVIVAIAANPLSEQAPAAPPERALPPQAPPARAVRSGALLISASFVLDEGTLPVLSYGASATAALTFSNVELGVVGTALASQSAMRPAPLDGQGVSLGLYELRGRACYEILHGRLALGPCLGGGAAWLVAKGFGASGSNRAVTDVIAVASAGAEATLGVFEHLSLRLAADAVIPFARPDFVIEHGGPVFQSSAVAGRATIGMALHF